MLKKAEVQDLDEILKLDEEIFGDMKWTKEFMKFNLENGHFLKFEEDSKIVGFAGVFQKADSIDLLTIGVKSGFRKRGIGKMLLKELIEFCQNKNAKEIVLEVNENNKNALELYSLFSFETIRKIPKYYKDENALLMILKLRG